MISEPQVKKNNMTKETFGAFTILIDKPNLISALNLQRKYIKTHHINLYYYLNNCKFAKIYKNSKFNFQSETLSLINLTSLQNFQFTERKPSQTDYLILNSYPYHSRNNIMIT